MSNPGMRFLLVVVFLFSGLTTWSQRMIKGQVLSEKNEPIPFAHLIINESSRGTISNVDGRFQLNLAPNDSLISITSIGYETLRLSADQLSQEVRVVLKSSIVELNLIVVESRDIGRGIVEKAIDRIPENYPARKEMLTGFIREKLSRDSLGTDIYFISEVEVEVEKEPYTSSQDKGNVRLVKGRKVTGDLSDLETRIYGGGHLVHRFDLVAKREGPLDKKSLDQFAFSVEDTLQYNEEALFKILFWNRKKEEEGWLYITDRSFAVVKAEYLKREGFGFSLSSNQRKFLKSTTEYFFQDSSWQLGFVDYFTGFDRSGGRQLFLNSTYNTTQSRPIAEEIPYHERLQFGQFLLDESETYDSTYWDGFDTTPPSDITEDFFSDVKRVQPTDNTDQNSIMSRFEFAYSLIYMQSNLKAHNLSYVRDELVASYQMDNQTLLTFGLKSTIFYRLHERWRVGFESVLSVGDNLLSDQRLGISYRQPFGNPSRLFGMTSLAYGYSEQSFFLGAEDVTGTFTQSKKEIDASQVNLYTSTRRMSIVPAAGLVYEKSKRFQLFLTAEWFLPVWSQNGALIVEDQNLFKRRKVFVPESSKDLTLDEGNDSNITQDFAFNFGFILRLR